MSMVSPLWESLERELSLRLVAVGFRPTEFRLAGAPSFDEVTFASFESDYGILYLVKISAQKVKLITAATNFACDTMRTALANAGANDWSRDGYVLAAIPGAPDSTEVSSCLRVFEQGRAICRRHVIWPEPAGGKAASSWTARLDRVTLLALPEVEAPAVPNEQQPTGPAFLEDIRVRLKAGASYKMVADELVRSAKENKDFHAP